jgi:hypothetical protein
MAQRIGCDEPHRAIAFVDAGIEDLRGERRRGENKRNEKKDENERSPAN